MEKLSGVTLITVGAILMLMAVLRAITPLLSFTGASQTTYSIGFIAWASVVIISFIYLGLKAVKKGRLYLKAESLSIEQI